MADVIERVERRMGDCKYPWSQWCDGRAYAAHAGKDFTCSPNIFRNSLYGKAKSSGAKVVVAVHGETVQFQFSKRES